MTMFRVFLMPFKLCTDLWLERHNYEIHQFLLERNRQKQSALFLFGLASFSLSLSFRLFLFSLRLHFFSKLRMQLVDQKFCWAFPLLDHQYSIKWKRRRFSVCTIFILLNMFSFTVRFWCLVHRQEFILKS